MYFDIFTPKDILLVHFFYCQEPFFGVTSAAVLAAAGSYVLE